MISAQLSLIVLRAKDPAALAQFYARLLYVEFSKEKHDKGPEHYAAELAGAVLEIYPRTAKSGDTLGLRLGFTVSDVDAVWQQAIAAGAEVVSPPQPSPWGYRAVLKDPEGHVVELSS